MTRCVDLNADMGEGFGPWKMGDDTALLDIVTSANVACGFHAGDPDVMAQTMLSARQRGVGIGAHPGFADLQGFGRQRMVLPDESLANLIAYQIGAAQGMAQTVGAQIRHVKLHGALANMAAEDKALALTCYRAALSVVPDAIILVLAATAQESAAQALGCRAACEIFADRAYNDDATLVDRKRPGAVIEDPKTAAGRAIAMIEEGAIIAQSGRRIKTRIDTVCCHGDTANAINIARQTRQGIEAAGLTIRPFEGSPL